MQSTEKDLDKIFDLVNSKNAVDEATTFSTANLKFYNAHKNIALDHLGLLKLNPDFINSACNIVENLYTSTYKTNKKELTINMLKYCLQQKGLSYSVDELKYLDGTIESLHSNKKIKKISLKKKCGNKLSNFFLSFLN
jgi:hypothetical protein